MVQAEARSDRQFSPPLTPVSQSTQVTKRAFSVPSAQLLTHAPTSSPDETPRRKSMASGSLKRRDISFSVPPTDITRGRVTAEASSPRVRLKRVRRTSMGPPASPPTSRSRAKPVRRLPRPWQVRDDEEEGDESQDEIDLLTIPASQPAPAKRIRSESKRAETPAPVRPDEPLPAPVDEGAGSSASQTTQRSVQPSQQTPPKLKRPKSKQAEASVPVRGDDSSQQTPAKRIKRLESGSKQAEALPGVDEPLPAPTAGDTGTTACQASLSLVAPSQQTSAQRTRSESQWDETSPACQDDLLPAPVAGHTRRSPSEESQSSASPQPTSAEGMRAGSQQAEALAVHHDEPLPAPAAANVRPGHSLESQSSVAPVQLTASPPTPEQSIPGQNTPEQAAAQQKRSERQQAEALAMRRNGQLARSSPSQRDQSSGSPSLPTLVQEYAKSKPTGQGTCRSSRRTSALGPKAGKCELGGIRLSGGRLGTAIERAEKRVLRNADDPPSGTRKAAALAEEKTRSLMVNYARLAARKGDDYTVVRVQRRPGTAIDVDAEDASVVGPGTGRLARTQPASNQLSPRSFGPALPSESDAHASSRFASELMPTLTSADTSLEALALCDVKGLVDAEMTIHVNQTRAQLHYDGLRSRLSSLGISHRSQENRIKASKKQADRALPWTHALATQLRTALQTGARSIEVGDFPEAPARDARRTASQRAGQLSQTQ
ncbi:hypothetical protein PANT_11d00065 [Moesziomyces antarcticus T-34]|uniref:Uncharacterized protein n=1 Tax=Pseudozyma antarctica (strain T-34) TaxID=1151754 RepID=M9LQ52_PSEA3|nr:hypothetical protein PANT_11d00065 [Moesziomyces antarcticus T-34]